MIDKALIGIFVALGLSFFLLYFRKEKWLNPKIVWIICLILIIIGLNGLFNSSRENRDELIMYYGFCVPIIYWIMDRYFKHLSFKILNRDFILYMRFSTEIDDSISGDNPHVKISDKIFSLGLILIIVISILIGIVTL